VTFAHCSIIFGSPYLRAAERIDLFPIYWFSLLIPGLAAADPDFTDFLAALREDALSQGIQLSTLAAAARHLKTIPTVITLQKKQPEFKQSLTGYLKSRASRSRVEQARKHLAHNHTLLDSIARAYGVQARFIVALWSMESDFGRNMGSFPVLGSLTTLAYSSRRGAYFRRELLEALRVIDQGHVSPDSMLGSWAGAMGQCQFMPWNFNRHAVDFDADGRRDIWHTRADVLASIANFLRALGWRDDQTWGRPVQVPADFDLDLADGKTKKTLAQWQSLGVRRLNGDALPLRALQARLLRPARSSGRIYLIYANFDALLKWNRSHFFAITVGTLGDRLRP
jgi:membrane-bound lytic murein transglycosylase B